MKKILVVFMVGALASLSACKKEEAAKPADPKATAPVDPAKVDPAKTEPAKVDPAKTEPAKVDPAKTDPAKADPAAAGFFEWKTGVAECDAFIDKYLACIDTKYPEAQRQATKDGFKTSIDAWRAASADPNAKAALVQQCQAMQTTVQKSSEQMACTW